MAENQVALVTGASRGIGRAILEALAEAGYTVIGTATSAKGAEAISAHLAELKAAGTGLVLKVNDSESIAAALQTIHDQFDSIAVLVNNAGITEDDLLLRMSEDKWHAVIDTNLSSIYRMSKAVIRDMMKARFGRIISIASVVGVMGNAGQTNYAAAKAGLIGFSKSLAREVGSRGITVNTVAPGFIATDMTDALPEAQKEALIKSVPLAKLGHAEDVAQAVVYLAKASYVTGETIHVNGGMYMI